MLSVIFLLSRLCSDLALPAACMQQASCTVNQSKPNVVHRINVLIKLRYVIYESMVCVICGISSVRQVSVGVISEIC
jgi:hypothetical protein